MEDLLEFFETEYDLGEKNWEWHVLQYYEAIYLFSELILFNQ